MSERSQQSPGATLASAGQEAASLRRLVVPRRAGGDYRWALVAAVGVLAAGLLALGFGFRVVSDDDYARVLLAQRFARAPRLDPTGTSWLPFPFWAMGGVMRALGPTLAVARGFALASAGASGLLLWAAGRAAGLSSATAALGALLPFSAPALAPFAAAPVPELLTAALATYGVAAACFGGRLAAVAGGTALLAACLSRYEVWSLAAYAAVVCLARAAFGGEGAGPASAAGEGRTGEGRTGGAGRGGARAAAALAALLALAGPIGWLSWNHHAHGDALSFARRVASYHASVSPSPPSLAGLVAGYPAALVREAPGVVVAAAFALAFGRGARGRWALLLGAGLTQLVALAAAELRGGAPTHHPGRALAAAWCLFGLVAAGEVERLWRSRGRTVGGRGASNKLGALGAIAVICAFTVAISTGFVGRLRSVSEGFGPARAEELALGRALAARIAPGERVLVAPPSYGYLAMLVAFGRPDDVTALVPRAVDPRSTADDPFASPASLARAVAGARARWVLATGAQRAAAEASGLRGVPLTEAWWLYDARGAQAP
ncbi:MAG TPA: hypothetical protein VFS43_01010 [Polyangiaceae bacterium]|nr:hypothetical protein [Polyangiaceae bacterium]